jgi:hypothetical protein
MNCLTNTEETYVSSTTNMQVLLDLEETDTSIVGHRRS